MRRVYSVKWDFRHLPERHASTSCVYVACATPCRRSPPVTFCARRSSRSRVRIRRNQVLGTCVGRERGRWACAEDSVHAERIQEIKLRGGKDGERDSGGGRRAATSTEGQKRELDVKTPFSHKESLAKTYFSSWALAAISDLSVLSARGHPDTLERIKS